MKNHIAKASRFLLSEMILLTFVILIAAAEVSATANIDTTFGTDGRISITLGESQRVAAFALQSDDKIVAVGDVYDNVRRNGAIVRYNANGTPDTSFGSNGKVILPSAAAGGTAIYGLAVQTDGKIVIVGSTFPIANSSVTDFLIGRLNQNGSLDTSFGNGGIVTINQGGTDSLRAIKIQPDGKIVAVGGTSDEGGRAVVLRLNQNGSFDTTFSGGIVLIDRPMANNELFTSLDFYQDGRILVGGELYSGNGPGSKSGVAALLEINGALVQNFGGSGFLSLFLPEYEYENLIKVLPNGNIVASSGSPSRYSSEGVFLAPLSVYPVSDIDFLSNGNLVVLSRHALTKNGIKVLNRNFKLVGSDEAEFTSAFSGQIVKVQSNDKIIILRNGVLLRLNGVTSNATRLANFDEDVYDHKTDVGVFRPSDRTFYTLSSLFGISRAFQVAVIPTQIIPEKYYAAPFYSSFNYWQAESPTGAPGYFRTVGNNAANQTPFQWGASGDVAVGGDYDGDGLTDFTVFRPSNGYWYVSQSSNNQFRAFQFGQAGDKLVPADYDDDGITDFAVFRPSNGAWYVSRSSDGAFVGVQFGQNGDVPVTGDFDGDGRADFTVFRPSNGFWYSLKSREGFSAVAFGIASDQPVPGDYDGDGRHDVAVFRGGFWYLLQSRDGFRAVQWGLPDDVPISVKY